MSYDFWDRPPPPENVFARRLRRRREAAGLSEAALAARAGVEAMALRACESGREKISAAMLVRLARALDVPPSVFFAGE